jgi:HSP20 family protein
LVSRRWDPLSDLLTLQERMNRLFEESLSRSRLPGEASPSGTWTPLADVYETAEGFVVQVELPGLTPGDVEVQVGSDELVLRGERRISSRARPEAFHRMERSYGAFSRSFRFTSTVDPAAVLAQFRDGLLRLELPKLRARETRIRVETPE